MVFFLHLTIVCPTFISCGDLWRFMRVWWNDLMLMACPLFWLMVRCQLPQRWGELFDRDVKMWKEESTACLGGLFCISTDIPQHTLFFRRQAGFDWNWWISCQWIWVFVSTFLMLQFMLKYLRNDQSRMLISTPNYFLEAAFNKVSSPDGSWLIRCQCYWLRHWDAGGHKWYDKFVLQLL